MEMAENRRELELKLTLNPKELDRLAENPRLLGSTSAQRDLRSVYYDTPDHRLRDEGLVLRVRQDGEHYVQTIKADAELKGGLSNPIEIEDNVEACEPRLERISNKRIRRKIHRAIEGSILSPAFETIVNRTSYRLRQRGSVIELAMDRGEARARNRRSAICEVELELIEGNPKHLLEAAHWLFAKSRVHPSEVSKAERGYRLLLKTQPSRTIEPVHAEPAKVNPSQTCGQAFAEILRSAGRQIRENRLAVLETEDPEGAHQLRVGLTRLRSLLRALKSSIDQPLLRRMEADARELSRAVGNLRDADVLIEDIYAQVAGENEGKPGFERLLQTLQQHRSAMQAKIREALFGEHWSRLLLDLSLWPALLESDASLKRPIDKYAGEALQNRWKKVAKYGRRLKKLNPEERHAMRKALKKLRYISEFFASLYDTGKTKQFIKQLKKLQTIFGYVNDVRLTSQLRTICAEQCAGDPDALIAAGHVIGYHEMKAGEVWKGAVRAWSDLNQRNRFWR